MAAPVDDDSISKTLFKHAMKGRWERVVKLSREHEGALMTKVTRSGDTALHIAVSDSQEEVVEQLVDIIRGKGFLAALREKNEQGNTPLHIAATIGNARMCYCIADKDVASVGDVNQEGETPLFLAAHHGKKYAFLCLHDIASRKGKIDSYYRKKNGDTILHSAIAGDYFDVAFQIIHLHKDLVNSVNEKGVSPLHVLASKHSAFRSGSHLRRWGKIIYHCTLVDELEVATNNRHHPPQTSLQSAENLKFPENYTTCLSFTGLIKTVIQAVILRQERGQGAPKDTESQQGYQSTSGTAEGHHLFPPNYSTCFLFAKLVSKAFLIVLGLGSTKITKIREKKEKHIWSIQVMNQLLESATNYEYEHSGMNPQLNSNDETMPYAVMDEVISLANLQESQKPTSGITQHASGYKTMLHDTGFAGLANPQEIQQSMNSEAKATMQESKQPSTTKQNQSNRKSSDNGKAEGEKKNGIADMVKETPLLIAAKNGITEIVVKILDLFPVAIHDINPDKKNIVLLAVENRQPHVYKLLLNRQIMKDIVFRAVDKEGNSALHLAARLGDHKPWLIPGAALQMQWEVKWYEFVKNSMPLHFFVRYNAKGQTPKDIFTETHQDLVKNGAEWLTNTSESCSVVAALIATVAFATSASVPGGIKEENGKPILETQPAFKVFAISSLVALCFSVTSVVMFLAILTSRHQERDFGNDLPRKLLFGLTSLFVSIASILISFCAGHFFMLRDELKYAAFPVYAVTCLPITFFAIAQFPLYFDLIWATFKKVPQRSYKVIPV